MALRTTRLNLPRALQRKIGGWLADIPLDKILVEQAKRRIDNGGDSQIRYRRLWANRFRSRKGRSHFRQGGKPLLDTRQHIYNTLNGTRTRQGNTILYTLRGSLAAVFHHNGFKTKGPNFIPLTLHARRTHRKGNDPRLEGLVKDVDYIMAWKGVDVPARPIFRIAPEDRRQIIRTIQVALRRRTSRRAA